MADEPNVSLARYDEFLGDLKVRIRTAQVKAALSVNRELVLLYWQIGRDILARQQQQGWGPKVIERLSKDLCAAFPEMKGLSPRNLKYMRAVAEAYPEEAFVQQVVAPIPWGHNVRILDTTDGFPVREWYIRQTIQYGWSRNILEHQIDSRLFERQRKALTNFALTLPAPQTVERQRIRLSRSDEEILRVKSRLWAKTPPVRLSTGRPRGRGQRAVPTLSCVPAGGHAAVKPSLSRDFTRRSLRADFTRRALLWTL